MRKNVHQFLLLYSLYVCNGLIINITRQAASVKNQVQCSEFSDQLLEKL